MVTVLTSGVALGVHVPGVLLARRLRAAGVPADVVVLESLLTTAKRMRAEANRAVFHADFRLARAGHRIVRLPTDDVDPARRAALFARWHDEQAERFVVFSGFWTPLLRAYAYMYETETGRPVHVDVCHVDSVDSPSFRAVSAAIPRTWQTVRLADAAATATGTTTDVFPTTIPVTDDPFVPWHQRLADPRVLAHGGGWGMGTYRDGARALAERGIATDLVLHDPIDTLPRGLGDRRFAIDPGWHPWHDADLPPFAELPPSGDGRYVRAAAYHGSFDLVRGALAVASKPGGGTLLDSLHAATPLLLLDALAPHEERNARLWRDLGFGVDFDAWLATGCPFDTLAAAHRRLAAVGGEVPDYSAQLVKEFAAS